MVQTQIARLSETASDAEFIILENLYGHREQNSSLKQRDLARAARTSLGMMNSILKRMVQKGWITAKKLNSRNINYAITIDGINEIIHRSYNYFKRTIKNVVYYKDTIEEIIKNAAENKTKTVLLLGTSDLDFIIEHACNYYGLSFIKSADSSLSSGTEDKYTLVFFAEDIPFSKAKNKNYFYISRLLLKNIGE